MNHHRHYLSDEARRAVSITIYGTLTWAVYAIIWWT